MVVIGIVTATVIIVLEMFYTYLNMYLDGSTSKNIQNIIVTPKERLYMGKSGKIRTISGFLGKNRKIKTGLKNQE
jgi:hypothetical protein